MDVALIGATGRVGGRLIAELLSRDHAVTGIARSQPAEPLAVPVKLGDATDPKALAQVIAGHDAVILAGRFVSVQAEPVLAAMAKAGIDRLLVVGGAGTLEVSPGVQLLDTGLIPEAFLSEVSGGRDFLAALQGSLVDWTFLSPAAKFVPGERTGCYRLGGDELMSDAEGQSRISYEDLAKALVDELEHPQHRRQRFSIAY